MGQDRLWEKFREPRSTLVEHAQAATDRIAALEKDNLELKILVLRLEQTVKGAGIYELEKLQEEVRAGLDQLATDRANLDAEVEAFLTIKGPW
jgi:hypothetical protein